MDLRTTYESLAVDVGIIASGLKEAEQVPFNLDKDESQPLAAIVVLAEHAEEFDDIGMVEPATRPALDVDLLRIWISEGPAERATTYLVHESIFTSFHLYTEPLHDDGDPRCGPGSLVHVGGAAEPGRDERVVMHVCKVVAIGNLATLRCGLRMQLVHALRGRQRVLIARRCTVPALHLRNRRAPTGFFYLHTRQLQRGRRRAWRANETYKA
jgi:hypothetical protein